MKMKNFKRAAVLTLALAITAPIATPYQNNMAVVEAASVKINKSKATLEIGKTVTLKITGTSKKPVWTSDKTSVAAVNKTTGKVTAKKEGTATITGKIGTKKYTCKITVKSFADKKTTSGKLSFYIPKDWEAKELSASGVTNISLYPKNAKIGSSSGITVTQITTSTPKPSLASIKAYYKDAVTEETQKAALEKLYGGEITIKNFKQSFKEKYKGVLAVTSFTATTSTGESVKFTANELWVDNYMYNITYMDLGDKVSPSLSQVTDHIFSTIKVSK